MIRQKVGRIVEIGFECLSLRLASLYNEEEEDAQLLLVFCCCCLAERESNCGAKKAKPVALVQYQGVRRATLSLNRTNRINHEFG